MTIQEIENQISTMKARIVEIDNLLDFEDSIPDAEIDRLEEEARNLMEKIGILEQLKRLKSERELKNVSDWTKNFLSSFPVGTQVITKRQAEVFRRMNHGDSFNFNGRHYDFSISRKFGMLIVINIDF